MNSHQEQSSPLSLLFIYLFIYVICHWKHLFSASTEMFKLVIYFAEKIDL